jgi:hypothetical protein
MYRIKRRTPASFERARGSSETSCHHGNSLPLQGKYFVLNPGKEARP